MSTGEQRYKRVPMNWAVFGLCCVSVWGDLVLGVKIQKMSHKQAYLMLLLETQMQVTLASHGYRAQSRLAFIPFRPGT